MTRQSITFSDPAVEALRARAHTLGISVSDLVRRVVDEWREPKPARPMRLPTASTMIPVSVSAPPAPAQSPTGRVEEPDA